jgi:hypothetical protein
MRQKNIRIITAMRGITAIEGERIEDKIFRIVNNGEPIEDRAPIIYQERKAGIDPSCNIRTDRWEVAIESMEALSKHKVAKREGIQKERKNEEPEIQRKENQTETAEE